MCATFRVVSGFVCDTACVHGFPPKGAWFSRRNRTCILRAIVKNKLVVKSYTFALQNTIRLPGTPD